MCLAAPIGGELSPLGRSEAGGKPTDHPSGPEEEEGRSCAPRRLASGHEPLSWVESGCHWDGVGPGSPRGWGCGGLWVYSVEHWALPSQGGRKKGLVPLFAGQRR
ncbi:unnamed protein product [Pipistrellus nathusii]|uniref:Uncharacterized protein n=1 Tax=Pipistrellus nathusii TaxID=59473 RepID=A0ABN9ZR77_PIPNA